MNNLVILLKSPLTILRNGRFVFKEQRFTVQYDLKYFYSSFTAQELNRKIQPDMIHSRLIKQWIASSANVIRD